MARDSYKSIPYRLAYGAAKAVWFFTKPQAKGVRCLVICNDEVLAVRHTYGNRQIWTFPGGGNKKHEPNQTAVEREVREEINIELAPTYFATVESFEDYKRCLTYGYFCRVQTKPIIKIDPGEIAEAWWFKLNNLPPMTESARKLVDEFF
jgi:ADP-ribose pyrophosphatase YjhB (NUDIX family)